MARDPSDPPGYWNIWWTLSALFLALTTVFTILEVLGVLRDASLALKVLSVGLALFFGLTASTRSSVRRLEHALGSRLDQFGSQVSGLGADLSSELASVGVSLGPRLDRIAELLEHRLPRPGA